MLRPKKPQEVPDHRLEERVVLRLVAQEEMGAEKAERRDFALLIEDVVDHLIEKGAALFRERVAGKFGDACTAVVRLEDLRRREHDTPAGEIRPPFDAAVRKRVVSPHQEHLRLLTGGNIERALEGGAVRQG